VSFDDLHKILDLIEFPVSEHQFELIRKYSDETNQGTVHAYEFVNQIIFAKEITASFDINRWTQASRDLAGRYQLLEAVHNAIESMKDAMI
jgi:hypothetical protein